MSRNAVAVEHWFYRKRSNLRGKQFIAHHSARTAHEHLSVA